MNPFLSDQVAFHSLNSQSSFPSCLEKHFLMIWIFPDPDFSFAWKNFSTWQNEQNLFIDSSHERMEKERAIPISLPLIRSCWLKQDFLSFCITWQLQVEKKENLPTIMYSIPWNSSRSQSMSRGPRIAQETDTIFSCAYCLVLIVVLWFQPEDRTILPDQFVSVNLPLWFGLRLFAWLVVSLIDHLFSRMRATFFFLHHRVDERFT